MGMTAATEGAVDEDSPVFQRREEELDDLLREYGSVSRVHTASTALAPQGFRRDGDHPHDAPNRRTGEREEKEALAQLAQPAIVTKCSEPLCHLSVVLPVI
jgi:hypothetical protein